ncbi:hypothetical protein ACFQ05_34295 [Amycolatopsis umgeniensis]|uniref:Uncharacterized protein n=1 Tax=Amycolatopsis umgeniensis TaxID=336628 RepID=A0A841B4N2_9PSEU|nr:hypothetical protein [Amycolatopsis umgeniensis]MBB5855979.1 hypothetical protein [Amycolatopsis umgeniensis]
MRSMGKTLGSTAAVVLIAACDPAPPEDAAVHTDPAPVVRTFPEIVEASGAQWRSCELPMNGKARTAFVADGADQAFLTSTIM